MHYTRQSLEFQRGLYSELAGKDSGYMTTVTTLSLVAFLDDMITLHEERDALTAELAQVKVGAA